MDFFEGSGDVFVELFGVVEVDDEDDLLAAIFEYLEKRDVDPFGDADGEAGVEPDPFDVGYGVEGLK